VAFLKPTVHDRITDLTFLFRDAQARGENKLGLFRRDGV
jgi:hypothetical protein